MEPRTRIRTTTRDEFFVVEPETLTERYGQTFITCEGTRSDTLSVYGANEKSRVKDLDTVEVNVAVIVQQEPVHAPESR